MILLTFPLKNDSVSLGTVLETRECLENYGLFRKLCLSVWFD